MNARIQCVVLLLAFLVGFSVPASATVTSDEAKRFLDYYYNGKGGGGVFIDGAICRELVTEGEEKNNCREDIDYNHFPVDNDIYAWVAFLVPKGDSDTVYVEFKNMEMVWKNIPLTVKEGIRYRTWAKYTLDKKGEWTITFKKVDFENQKSTILKEIKVMVK